MYNVPFHFLDTEPQPAIKMATHTHPQLYPRDPQPQRPHTHPHSSPPGLLSRDAPSPPSRHLRLPAQDHHHHQQPNSWHASPYPQPLPSLGEKSHRSLPTEIRTLPPQKGETSVASLENARYSTDGTPRSEHTNEDRHFEVEVGAYRVFGVFDGHDGPRAAGFASNYFIQYFSSDSWNALTSLPPHTQKQQIPLALKGFFKAAEKDFFNSIRSYIEERKQLQRTIPRVSAHIMFLVREGERECAIYCPMNMWALPVLSHIIHKGYVIMIIIIRMYYIHVL